MVILAAIAAALAVVLIARLAGGRKLPARWSSRSPSDTGPQASLPQVQPIALSALRQQFHVLALGLPALPEETPGPAHQALLTEVSTTLGRADLSPRYTPRRPQLLPQLIQSVNDSTASARSISRIIGSDPVLAVNLLRIANSPLYRFQRREVQSIERAVTLVGNDGIRQIISAALIQPVMNPSDRDGGRFSRLLWDHTLRMSLAAADHARSMEREDGFAAQLAALLRGLSVAMVVQATADAYARRPLLQPSAVVLLQLIERCAAETAARIARHWELAPAIVQALQDSDGAGSGLGRSLQLGELAASLSMLCNAGALPADEAEAQLALQLPAHVAGWLWKRVSADAADGADSAA
ncbi:hypothetical protein ARC78_10580 [Stenotrophomonas pictorum JCM 9942]|uniref:HDOD domain-containing protein n=3 Tax=Stenotrophomonas pictorum TaxID=86184 RepID=A0A0R0AA48_9GAMM|nr:hypothetical protein ARC78_10580 [Stenotrophomonas pictorum JCM 9942]